GGRRKNKKIVFSGDLGNTPEPIEQPTEFIDSSDFVVMESTYGGRTHSTENALEVLQKEINTVENFNSALLIPAFSLERTQTLLHMIDHLKKEGKVKNETTVYLDSPMAIKATYIYTQFPNYYSKELSEHTNHDDPFDFPGLVSIDSAKESNSIEQTRGTKVIIAGSGMMSGGRILSHAAKLLPIPTTRLLFVGFQAEGTIGRQILEGAKVVSIYGSKVTVNVKLRELTSISAHADEPKLLNWLSKIKNVQTVFLTHGEDEARKLILPKIQNNLHISNVYLPKLHEEVKLV
ncbi:MBL fold metallo-hydrolase, partial [Candidatus Microgenomates bacterium]|nr:MBL fold metallo-hydrolase [Candidatus Microgenomates bacterium]